MKYDLGDASFITYDDGTIFKFEQQANSFWEYSDALGMYVANVRYSKKTVLREGIIEVGRVKIITIQGVVFEVAD